MLEVRVTSIAWEAQGIHSFELRPCAGAELPGFTAGSHIDVKLPTGIQRSYSLVNAQDERHRYVIAVSKAVAGRGGSAFMHDVLRVGDVISVSAPKNNFVLNETAPHSVFIAGGIGITPLLCMVQRLQAIGRSWELHYCTRVRSSAALVDRCEALAARGNGKLHLYFDHEPKGRKLDLAALVKGAPADAHLYCCGPASMLEAFEQACNGRPADHLHVEYFSAKELPSVDGGFTVELAKSGQAIAVRPGNSILDALLDAGIDVPNVCREGVCGTCETRVLEGVPDHRDAVLSTQEKAANRTMMICCSGAKTQRLVLDL